MIRIRRAGSPRLSRTYQPSRRDKGGQPKISILGVGGLLRQDQILWDADSRRPAVRRQCLSL